MLKCNKCKREAILVCMKEPLCEYHWQLHCAKESQLKDTELMGYIEREEK